VLARIAAAAIALSLAVGVDAQESSDLLAPEGRTIEFRGLTMGATFLVKVVPGPNPLDSRSRRELDRVLRGSLDRIDQLMSTWDRDSELSRFNRSTSLEPFPLSLETFEVLQWSLKLAVLTGGALDVTVGPLVDAWGFGPGGPRNRQPTGDEIARMREATGPHRIELDPVALTARKSRPEVRCDLSALAPGYATDRLWSELANRGFTDFLVDVGGERREPWRVAIDRPQPGSRDIQRIVPVSDLAIATSGDYRRYREVNGRRVAHVVDPRTGRPIAHRLASVTVIDELAVRADGLSTALMVLGTDEGFSLAEKLHLAALFIERTDEEFSERATRRFEAITSSDPRQPSHAHVRRPGRVPVAAH